MYAEASNDLSPGRQTLSGARHTRALARLARADLDNNTFRLETAAAPTDQHRPVLLDPAGSGEYCAAQGTGTGARAAGLRAGGVDADGRFFFTAATTT
jgi:ABC-type hemin transport system substrate-binding protein